MGLEITCYTNEQMETWKKEIQEFNKKRQETEVSYEKIKIDKAPLIESLNHDLVDKEKEVLEVSKQLIEKNDELREAKEKLDKLNKKKTRIRVKQIMNQMVLRKASLIILLILVKL